MKVIFFSEKCDYCKKLLAYLDKNNIMSLFKLINIDINDVPDEIDIVPTILDTDLNQPLKGKKAFEYLLNIKYFNNPTNNIEYVKELPPNPDIPLDEKAISSTKNMNLEIETKKSDNKNISLDSTLNELFKVNDSTSFYNTHKDDPLSKTTQDMLNQRQIQDKKLSVLLQMKRR